MMSRVISSYGVACFYHKIIDNIEQIYLIVIERLWTYNFEDFMTKIAGGELTLADVKKLIEGMTEREKSFILNCRDITIYDLIKYKIYNRQILDSYRRKVIDDKKVNYNSNPTYGVLRQGDIRTIIYKSSRSEITEESNYEPPKGRQKKDESCLATAEREFREETGRTCKDYKILSDIPMYSFSFIDDKNEYEYGYYFARCYNFQFTLENMRKRKEVLNIHTLNEDNLKNLKNNKHRDHMLTMYQIYVSHYNKSKK